MRVDSSMAIDPDVVKELVVVSNSILDPSIEIEIDISTYPDVGAKLVLVVESVVDILIKTEIEM